MVTPFKGAEAGSIQIRDFRQDELEQLWAIDQSCFDRDLAYSRAELRFYLNLPRSFTLVAEVAPPAAQLPAAPGYSARAIAIGFVVAHPVRNTTGHIITIDVVKQWQRTGAGTQLLQGAEDRLKQLGCNRVELETAVNNVGAMAFYHSRGYHILRTIRGYYSNGLNALLMEKMLT